MDAEAIVRALAARESIQFEFDLQLWECRFCQGDGLTERNVEHTPDCPWALAREWVAEHPASRMAGDVLHIDVSLPTAERATWVAEHPEVEPAETWTINGHAVTPGPLVVAVGDYILWDGITWRIDAVRSDGVLECSIIAEEA